MNGVSLPSPVSTVKSWNLSSLPNDELPSCPNTSAGGGSEKFRKNTLTANLITLSWTCWVKIAFAADWAATLVVSYAFSPQILWRRRLCLEDPIKEACTSSQLLWRLYSAARFDVVSWDAQFSHGNKRGRPREALDWGSQHSSRSSETCFLPTLSEFQWWDCVMVCGVFASKSA